MMYVGDYVSNFLTAIVQEHTVHLCTAYHQEILGVED